MTPEEKNEEVRFTLRIDRKIYHEIKMSAEKNKRSTAKEIEFILEKWIENNQKE